MTKIASLQQWFEQFGIPAYASQSVPDDAEYPWLTYEQKTGDLSSGDVYIAVYVYYYTESEAVPNAMVEKISEALGIGGAVIACDGGGIWIKKGSPWSQQVPVEDNKMVKGRLLNISLEFLTT